MKYVCAFIFSILILSGCKNTIIDGSIPNGGIVDTTWGNQPAMSFTFGLDTYNYTERQMSCEASNFLDPFGNYYTIHADNGSYVLQIIIVADSLRLQSYTLDGEAGNITIYKDEYGKIGIVGPAPSKLQITSITPGRISGNFYGDLLSPQRVGNLIHVEGAFTNILYTY